MPGGGGAEGVAVVPLPSARRRRLALAGGGLVAAAAVVVAVVLGIQVGHLHNQLNTTPALTRAEQAALVSAVDRAGPARLAFFVGVAVQVR